MKSVEKFWFDANASHLANGLFCIMLGLSDTSKSITTITALVDDHLAHVVQQTLLVQRMQQCVIACAQGSSRG
jgi:aerobic-type carbon monoxide dehydrogenase small subunit (CoxS/CutS family)